jgi:uncharacterized protein YyaL (SSP411 family)
VKNLPNHLAEEVSPYLLQHAHNPVFWMPWGEEVWKKAKAENKPVFLSIGYSTCHWCHVMERESFESEVVAEVLNRDFIPVKVDREERPDVDRIYMTAVQAMTGQGGWPLSVWVTPEGKPFYGGTYYPPSSSYGRAGFIDVLGQISSAWKDRNKEVVGWAEELSARIRLLGEGTGGGPIADAEKILQTATDQLAMEYDRKNGGFGGAPKFPRPSQPLFLLRRSFRERDEKLLEMIRHTGRAMRAGGIYDQIGGGFHRYAVDGEWAVPHFEKMLYDNGQLMGLYAELGAATGEEWPWEVVAGVDRYFSRDLRVEGGGLASAEDADSEGVEGKFYVWTRKEVLELAKAEEFKLAEEIWGVTEEGNFMDPHHPVQGWNVLAQKRVPSREEEKVLEGIRARLEKRREERIRPGKDDKVLTSWNALAISGYARAGSWGGGRAYAQKAEEVWGFLEKNLLRADGTPIHRWRNGKKDDSRLLEDYAGVLQALIDLHQATLKVRYLNRAVELAEKMLETFEDRNSGGLWASSDESLLAKMKDDYDGAEPSGNAVAALALAELGRLTDQPKWTEAARRILNWLGERMRRLPQAVPHALLALERLNEAPARLVLAGEGREKFLGAGVYRPDVLITGAAEDHPSEFIRGLAGRTKEATAYLCEGQSCRPPVESLDALKDLLRIHPR